jgi:Bacterial Ig domain
VTVRRYRFASAAVGLVALHAFAHITFAQSSPPGVIAGGGGQSAGGNFTVTGTIGQPMSGTLAGGGYTLVGGFWSPVFLPLAADDSYTATSGQTLVVAAPGVLANDSTATGGQLTSDLISGAAHGELTFNPDGSFTYIPDAQFVGLDSFTYSTHAARLASRPAIVTLSVMPPSSGDGTGGGTGPGATPELGSVALLATGLMTVLAYARATVQGHIRSRRR